MKTCGICGEQFEIEDMAIDAGSETGWICIECLMEEHPEYLEY